MNKFSCPKAILLLAALAAQGKLSVFADTVNIPANDGAALASAVSAAGDDTVILLPKGTYNISSPLRLEKSVELRGTADRPDEVVIHQTATSEKNGDQIGRGIVLKNAGAKVFNLTVENGNCYNTSAGVVGGNIYIDTAGGMVSNCVIRNGVGIGNWGSAAGGVALFGGLVTHCVITNNSGCANKGGSGAYVSGGTLANSLLVGNYFTNGSGSDTGGIISLQSGTVYDCTIAGNTVNWSCAGIYAKGGKAYNCLIADNTSGSIASAWSGTASCFDHCVFDTTAPASTACAQGKPQFVDAAKGDYRLLLNSAALDAGTSVAGQPSVDLAGNPRVDSQTGIIDIGCYETVRGAVAGAFSTDVNVGKTPLAVTFTAVVDNAPGATLKWDFDGDGTIDKSGTETTVSHTYIDGGQFTPACTMTYGGKDYEVPTTDRISVYGEALYVNPAATKSAFPYASPDAGAKTIAEAVASAYAGVPIVIAKGTYNISAPIKLTEAIEVRGETGKPEDVVIHQTSTSVSRSVDQIGRGVWLSHADAKVSSVTIENGNCCDNSYRQLGGNVFISANGGTVSNCIIRGGWSKGWGNGGSGVGMSGGLVTHCVISNNNSYTDYGGAGAYVAGGTLQHSLIVGNSFNGGVSSDPGGAVRAVGGTVYNCTIADNAVAYSCAGVNASGTARVQNCVISGNSTKSGKSSTSAAWDGTASCFHNCLSDVEITGGDSCATGAAGFVPEANDWHLTVGSSARNLGAVLDGHEDDFDLDGNPCVRSGKTDAGCYQFLGSGASLGISADVAKGVVSFTVTFTATVEGLDNATISWDFDGDGMVDKIGTETTQTFVYTKPGVFTPRASATSGSTTVQAENVASVTAFGKRLYVSGASKTPAEPYDCWTNACADLLVARTAAMDGMEIVVSNGTYSLSGTLEIDKAVTCRGLSGKPEDVILTRPAYSGTSGYYRLANLSSASAVLADLTLSGGCVYETSGKCGGALLISKGLATNLVVRNGLAKHYGSYGGGVALTGGTLANSIVTNNQACMLENKGLGGGLGIHNAGGTVMNCLVGWNKSDEQTYTPYVAGAIAQTAGTVCNCTVVGNTTLHGCAGIVARGGTVLNCLVLDNVTSDAIEETDDVYRGELSLFTRCVADRVFGENKNFLTGRLEFADRANGNYRPVNQCVVMNKGCMKADQLPDGLLTGVDLDGEPRVEHNKIDVGAYEGVYTGPGLQVLVK